MNRRLITSIDLSRKGPSTSAVRTYMPTVDLAKIQGSGFEYLRPIWDLDLGMNADGTINHAYMDGIFDALARWLTLSPTAECILCPFRGPNTLGWSAWKETVGGDPTRTIKFYQNLIAYINGRAKTLPPGRLWIEILNEPEIPAAVWKPIQKKVYDAIRARTSTIGLILSFGGTSGLSDIMGYGPVDYSGPTARRRWSFHEYTPWWLLRQLGNAPGVVYDIDYTWPMTVPELCERFLVVDQDPVLLAKIAALKEEQALLADVQSGAAPQPVGQTVDGLSADIAAKTRDVAAYADNMVRYDAWGIGGREWTMTGSHDAVPFTDEGLLRTLTVARNWEIQTGETLMMTEGGGGGWAFGSQTPEARATTLRLQASKARVYKALGWTEYGWWMGNSLFVNDMPPGQRQVDPALLASVADGVAI